MAEGPKVIHSRTFLRDPLTGEWVADEIPNVTIKRALLQATQDAESMRGSLTVSGTAAFRVTYLHLGANIADQQYALVDRTGTIDIFRVGTAVGANKGQTDIVLQGDVKAPIHTAVGTFAIYSGPGSQSAGSFTIVFEGVQQQTTAFPDN